MVVIIVLGIVLRNKDIKMTNIKVGIDAFNDLAKSHDAHAKEVERLQKELEQTKNSVESALRGIQEIKNILNKNIIR